MGRNWWTNAPAEGGGKGTRGGYGDIQMNTADEAWALIFSFLLSYLCFFSSFSFLSFFIVYLLSHPSYPRSPIFNLPFVHSLPNYLTTLPPCHLTLPIPFELTNKYSNGHPSSWLTKYFSSLLSPSSCKLKQTSGIISYHICANLFYVKLKFDWTSWRYRDYNSSRSDVSAFIFFLFSCFYFCLVLVLVWFGQLVAVIIIYSIISVYKMWARLGWINFSSFFTLSWARSRKIG